MTVAGQSPVGYEYDVASRLTSVTQGASVVSMSYDNANRRTSLTLPNGIVVSSSYDAASQLTGLTYTLAGSTLGSLTYSYDAAGNRSSVGGTWARTALPAAMSAATYDAANQVSTWNGTSFAYDAGGNLTFDGTSTYTWNSRNYDHLTFLTRAFRPAQPIAARVLGVLCVQVLHLQREAKQSK